MYHLCTNELIPLARNLQDPWLLSLAFWHAGKFRDSVEALGVGNGRSGGSGATGNGSGVGGIGVNTGGVSSSTSAGNYRLRCGARDPRSLKYCQEFLLNKLRVDKKIDIYLDDISDQTLNASSTTTSLGLSFLRSRQPVLAYLSGDQGLGTLRSLLWLYLSMNRTSEDFVQIKCKLSSASKAGLWRSAIRPLSEIAKVDSGAHQNHGTNGSGNGNGGAFGFKSLEFDWTLIFYCQKLS